MKNEALVCTWPSCKCTARGQCKGLGVRADLCNPMQDERVKRLVEALRTIERGTYDGLEVTRLNAIECRVIARAALCDMSDKDLTTPEAVARR